MLLEGMFLPLTTPFHADGRLFVSKVRYNVERYSRTPAAGLVVLGEVGEADGLSDEETRWMLTAAIESAAMEKVMVASIGRESVFSTLEVADFAAKAGYDAIAVRGTSFSAEDSLRVETETYFRAVADGASLPVVLVSEPGRVLDASLITKLAGHSNVIGLIDGDEGRLAKLKALTSDVRREVTVTSVFAAATGRMLRSAVTPSLSSLGGVPVLVDKPRIKTRLKTVGFQILCTSTSAMLESWQNGASGAVPRAGSCAPQACCEVWQAFRDGDLPLADEKQYRLRGFARQVQGLAGIGAMKYGADFNGYFGGRPRLPLLGLTAAGCSAVEVELSGMRN